MVALCFNVSVATAAPEISKDIPVIIGTDFNEFSFENVNLRIMTNEGNTALSWVNEKGTAQITLVNSSNASTTISGTPNLSKKR